MEYTDMAFIEACRRLREMASGDRIQENLVPSDDLACKMETNPLGIPRQGCLNYG